MSSPRCTSIVALCLLLLGCAPVQVAADPTPEASNVPVEVPEELLHAWIGEERDIEGLASSRESAIFEFGPHEPILSFGGTLSSDVVRFDATEFVIALAADEAGCNAGATGRYRWSLSPAGDTLTLENAEDECPARGAALPGTWTRSDCPLYPENFCLGPLEAGTHQSIFFNPFVPFDEWEYERGVMTYQVPAGWTNTSDFPHKFRLQPQERSGEPGIFMWSEARIVSDEQPCSTTTEPDFTPTPDAFVGWLVNHPGLETTEPEPVIIGGVHGVVLEAEVRADADLPCTGFGPYLPMLADDANLQWGFEPQMRKRLYLLGLGDDRTVIISIEASGRDLFGNLIDEATGIVESIEFQRP
jgi:hypothetical protein